MKSNKERKELIKIVNEVFLLDLTLNNRKRETVDARKIYSKILKERGHTFQAIGKEINKDHATIVHYLKDIDFLLSSDSLLMDKYIYSKTVFLKNKDFNVISSKDKDCYLSLIKLTNQIEEMKDNNLKLLENFINYIEDYKNEKNNNIIVSDIRNIILPLFNKK
jgi:Sec7-like guanine-nucleotide exchange factor